MITFSSRIRAFLAALFISLGSAAACLYIPALSEAISKKGNQNLLIYAMTVILFCALCFLFCLCASFHEKKTSGAGGFKTPAEMTPSRALILGIILCAVNFLFLTVMYTKETEVFGSFAYKYIWHSLPLPLVLGGILCLCLFALFCLRKSHMEAPSAAFFLLYGVLTVLTVYNFYTPEIFLRDASERHHTHAYFNSVYNVLHGSAYNEYTTSIYGHYALFYKLPLKLLGGDHIDFVFLNACVGGLCFFAMFLALHLMVKNGLLRILGAVAMTFPVLSMRSGIYWQLWPHRILFMSLMLCYGAFCARFCLTARRYRILGYVLAALAILWNTETGIFCTAAWAGFHVLHLLSDRTKSAAGTVFGIFCHFLGCILSFLGAYGIVELYNIHCQGKPEGLREFLFPLLQSSYMDGTLRVDLPKFPSAYVPVLALLLLGTAWGISNMRFFRIKTPSNASAPELSEIPVIHPDSVSPAKSTGQTTECLKAPLLPCYAFSTSVLGLGQLTYFINRAAYHNLEICHLPCILLLCLMAPQGLDFLKHYRFKGLKKFSASSVLHGAFTLTALTVLLTLCTGNLIQYGYNTSMRQPFHNRQEATDFAANVAANIPENTYGFGIGVAEIYSMLRWDTGCYSLDFSDLALRPRVGDHIIDDIRTRNLPGFLAGEGAVQSLKSYCSESKVSWLLQNYEVNQTFEFKGMVIEYYTRK